MIKAEALIYMIRSTTGFRQVTGTSSFTDKNTAKVTSKWAGDFIKKHFPEFVISGTLILLCRTYKGYRAVRTCTKKEIDSGFCFKYLEITAEEEPAVS